MGSDSFAEHRFRRECDRFARECREGNSPRIEDYLQGCSEPDRTRLLIQLLTTEWKIRVETGDEPSDEEYLDRFPEQRDLIRSLRVGNESMEEVATQQLKMNPDSETPADKLDSATDIETAWITGAQTPPDPQSRAEPHGPMDPQSPADAGSIRASMVPPELRGEAGRDPRSNRYEVQSELGRGGMGIVYKARDQKLGRTLAIKIQQASQHRRPEDRQREVARFLDEAKLSAQLDHPGLVPVYELDHDASVGFYFTMRLVKGKHFGEVCRLARAREDGWNLPRAVGVIVKACEAIAYAHSKHVIHRDLKPSNLMVGRFGAVYVMDWGLAKVLGEVDHHDLRPQWEPSTETHTVIQSERQGSGESTADTPLITMDGSVIGTPAYMPPEQAKGLVDEVDDQSDVYSLGAILYHLLTGQPPYVEGGVRLSPHTVLAMVLQGPPQRVKELNPDAPSELVAICDKAMARDKSRRYASSQDLAEDLQAYLDGRVVRAYRTGAVAELRSWVSRNRLTAIAGIGVLLAVVSGLLGIVAVQRQSARHISVAREETRRYLYDGNLQLVQQAWEHGAVFRARELLDRHTPSADETDLRSFGWYYYDNLCRQSEESPLLAHDDIVTSIDFSPDGSRIATGCNDGQVRLWETDGWKMRLLDGQHRSFEDSPQFPAVDALRFTPGGDWLISVGRQGDLLLHRLDADAKPVALKQTAYPWSLDVSSDGRHIIAPSPQMDAVLIWNIASESDRLLEPRRISVQETPQDKIQAIRFAPDGSHFFTLGTAGVAKRWRTIDGELVQTLGDRLATEIPLMDIAPNGKLLVVTHGNDVVTWDLSSGQRRGQSGGVALGMKDLAFSNTGEHVAACGLSDAGDVMIWKIEADGMRLVPNASRHQGRISRMARLTKGTESFVTVGGSDNVVKVWDFASGNLESTFRGHSNEVYGLAVSADGRYVATGGRGHEVRVWDLDATPSTSVIAVPGGTVWSAALSPDGQIVCTASADGNLRLWEAATGKLLDLLYDRRTTAGENLPAHGGSAQYVCFLPGGDGEHLLSCGKDGNVNLWNLTRRELVGQIPAAHERGTNAFSFTADGTKLVSGGDDGLVKLWDRSDLFRLDANVKPLRVIGPIGQAVWGLACSPTSDLVAASGKSADHTIYVWDLNSGSKPMALSGHTNNVTHLVFSADGATLGSCSQDSSARLWNVASGKELPSPQSPLRGHAGDIQCILFTPDGLSIVTASLDRTVRIWDRQTGESKCALSGHAGGVQFATISQSGDTLLTTGWDQTALLWRAPKRVL